MKSKKSIPQLLGRVLKQLRKKNKLTQWEVEDLSGISRSYLSEIESGKKTPTLETINLLAACYGTWMFKIIKETEMSL